MTTRSSPCGLQRTHRVAPDPSTNEALNIIEIRKGRWLQVQHILPKECKHVKRPSVAPLELQVQGVGKNPKEFGDVNEVDMGLNLEGDGSSLAFDQSNVERNISTHHQQTKVHVRASERRRSSLHSRRVLEKLTRTSANSMQSNSTTNLSNSYPDTMSQGSLHSVMEDGNTAFFFIHGVGGCSNLWQHQIAYFVNEGYEVIAPDLLGHGFSRAPHQSKAYTFKEHADDLMAVFDRFCKKRNVLVGHSYGACFCAKIAHERPRKVTKLVLISGGGPIPLEPESCQLFCLPSFVLACIKPIIINGFVSQAFHRDSKQTDNEKSQSFDVPAYVLRATMQGQDWREGDEEYHAAISASVMLIYGMQDELVLLDDEIWMNETIYASHLETIENTSHMVMIEQPEKVNHLIHDFILKDTMVHRHGGRCRTMSTRSTKLHGKTMPHVTFT